MNAPVQQHGIARRIFNGIAKLAMLGVVGIATLLLVLWVEHSISITLPIPTGSFAVGRAIYDWTDDEALDALAPTSGTRRELLIWIWYPATPGQPAANADYLPAPWRMAIEGSSGPLISKFLTKDLSKVHPNSLRSIDVSQQQPSYPVVIMRGGASREVASYTTLAEDLASHGYIVVGIDAPYRTSVVVFPDGRVMKRTPENNPELCFERAAQEQFNCLNKLLNAWTADIAFVLDRLDRLNTSDISGRFAGRLDMSRVGIFGHSFGGAQAAQFCALNSRCKAGIDIDGAPFGSVIQTGIPKPFMFLLSGQGDFSTDAEVRQIMADIQSIYNRLPVDGRLRVVIHGANHFTFSDDGALLKSHFLRAVLRAFGKLGIDGRRQLAVTSYCVHSFFDVYLKGTSPPPLNIFSSFYPEIQVLN